MRLSPRSLHPPRRAAGNPARLGVDWWRYARCFPRLPREALTLAGTTLLVLAVVPFFHAAWPLLFAGLPFVGPLAKRARNARRHFADGDVNAAKVLDPRTGLVACFADLGTHPGSYFPTVRLLRAPMAAMTGGPFASGDDLPAVSVYYGASGGHKWDSFNPVPAACATSDPKEIARLHALVPEWQWMFLNEALFQIPRPYLPGLYPVSGLTIADVTSDR